MHYVLWCSLAFLIINLLYTSAVSVNSVSFGSIYVKMLFMEIPYVGSRQQVRSLRYVISEIVTNLQTGGI